MTAACSILNLTQDLIRATIVTISKISKTTTIMATSDRFTEAISTLTCTGLTMFNRTSTTPALTATSTTHALLAVDTDTAIREITATMATMATMEIMLTTATMLTSVTTNSEADFGTVC